MEFLGRRSGQAMAVMQKSLDTGGSAQRMGIRTGGGHDPTAAGLAGLSPGLGTFLITFDCRPLLPTG